MRSLRLVRIGADASFTGRFAAHPYLRFETVPHEAWHPPPLIGGDSDYEMHCLDLS